MLNLSTREFFYHTAALRNAAAEGALVIACDPFQSQVQDKLDELFGPHASQSDTAVLKRSPAPKTQNSGPKPARRRISSTSAAGRKRRLELEDTLQMRLNKRPKFNIFLALETLSKFFARKGH
jgi:hypothetical protein